MKHPIWDLLIQPRIPDERHNFIHQPPAGIGSAAVDTWELKSQQHYVKVDEQQEERCTVPAEDPAKRLSRGSPEMTHAFLPQHAKQCASPTADREMPIKNGSFLTEQQKVLHREPTACGHGAGFAAPICIQQLLCRGTTSRAPSAGLAPRRAA